MKGISIALTVFSVLMAISCEEEDPGPFDIKGWIMRCEDRCEQQKKCNPDQFIWDHGDMDNCKRSCGSNLRRDENREFIEITPDKCLEKLYRDLKCIYGLGCSKLTDWKDSDGDDYPCAAKDEAASQACEGVTTGNFLADCNFPFQTGYTY